MQPPLAVYFRYYIKCEPANVKLIVIPQNTNYVICWQVFNNLLPTTSSFIIITTDTNTFITSVDCIVSGRTYCVQRKPFVSRNQPRLLAWTSMTHPVRKHRLRRYWLEIQNHCISKHKIHYNPYSVKC